MIKLPFVRLVDDLNKYSLMGDAFIVVSSFIYFCFVFVFPFPSLLQCLNSLKPFSGLDGVQVSLSVIRWNSQISDNRGMIFRGFVYNVSQLECISYCY